MAQLEDLLQQCTVQITIPSQPGWGTGFFVAPGLILTCAHVVKALAIGAAARIRWQQQSDFATAELIQLVPNLDLALLQFTPPNAALPCVYLDESLQVGHELYFFGYPDQDFDHGCPVTGSCEGFTGDVPPLIKFKLAQVRPGMSGSALLNRQTGKVCGMVKFTRDRSIDLGGGAIPTRVILEQFPQLRELQREFHQRDRRWHDLVTKQAEIDFQPYLRSILDNEAYREWQEVYTPTKVEDRQRLPPVTLAESPPPRFSRRLKLRVETVKPPESEKQRTESPEQREQVEQLDVLAGLRQYAPEHVLLVGKPGSGKSTSLERLLWEEADQALKQTANAKIPVLVKLRRCTGTIESLMQDFCRSHQLPLTLTDIETLLDQGRLLLLLDGLNELPEAFRTTVANFRDRYRVTTPMIVSTRELSIGGNLGIAKTLKMLPLTEPQMQEFVRGYLGPEGNRLFQQLKGDRLRKFAETPLLLWMLCRVFAQNDRVPANLGLAFREFTQLYDAEIQQDAPAASREQWSKLLRYLAFALMHDREPTAFRLSMSREEATDLLTTCLQQEGRANARDGAERGLKDLLSYHLLQPVMQPNYEEHIEFRHQLIQEYYAAEYLLRILPTLSDEQLKRDYLNYLKWTEPVALMLALVEEEDLALRVVKLALEGVDLTLGARLAGQVSQEWQKCTVEMVGDLDLTHWLKIELLGDTRSEHAIDSLKFFMTNKEPEIRARSVAAFGKIVNDAAISELCNETYDESEIVRGMVANSLGEIGTELAGSTLKQWKKRVPKETPYVDIRRQTALWDIFGDEEKPYLFRQLIVDDDFDFDRPVNLSHTNSTLDFHTLERGTDHEMPELRQFATAELRNYRGSAHEESIVNLLIKLISDPDSLVQETAFRELQNYLRSSYQSLVVDVFLKTAKNPATGLRIQVLERLQDYSDLISEEEIIRILIDTATDSNFVVRLTSMRIIETTTKLTFLPVLHQALNDEQAIRQRAAKALGKIGHKDSVPILIQAMADYPNDNILIKHVIKALGKIGGSLAVVTLGKILLDSRDDTLQDVLEALGDTKHRLAVPFLLKANFTFQQSSSSWLELKRIKALGETAEGDLLPTLVKSLKIASEQDYLEVASEQDYLEVLSTAIVFIQNRCNFYNYEVFQGLIPQGKTISLYFSYAPADETLQTQLANHLNLLERQAIITSWHHRQMLPGDDRAQVINDRLNSADIILLLISADSIADHTCYDIEINRAMERHQAGEARVIPILLRPVDWQGAPFSQLPVLPRNHLPVTSWSDRDAAFQEIAEGIREAAIELRRTKGTGA